tara:strand:+ start:2089 stop:2322 length:234 start_codon:yes stop_codon:yes gene_type:complete
MNAASAKAGFITHNQTDSKSFVNGITVVSIVLGTLFTLKQLQKTRSEELASAIKIGILEEELKDVKAQLNQQGLDII